MTSTLSHVDAHTALDALEAAVDLLFDADLGVLDDDGLLEAERRLEVQRRRLAAVDARQVREVDARDLGQAKGARTTEALLGLMLRVDPREAKARVLAADQFTPRTTLTGERLDAAFPQVAAALRAGEISAAHASTIARTIEELPLDVQAERDREIETQLLAEARRFAPAQLRAIARRLSYLYDQDGQLASDADRARRRGINYRRRADGSGTGTLELDPIAMEAFDTAMDAKLRAMSAEERGDRTPTQLRHDVFRDLMLMLLRTEQVPTTGGVTTTIVLTLTLQQWVVLLTLAGIASARTTSARTTSARTTSARTTSACTTTGTTSADTPDRPREAGPPGGRLAVTGHGALIPLDEVVPLLGDAQILPAVVNAFGSIRRIEAYGDKHRIFSENQRLAMAARDRGCTFPGCTSTPAYCEAHHVIEFADGGPTSVDNGTLVCPYHHRTFTTLGYQCVMRDGTPHWIPPTWIDPTQTPVRNTAHAIE